MFRDPLAPLPTPWSAAPTLHGLDQWQLSAKPFTTHIPQAAGLYNADGGYASVVGVVATLVQNAQRGMIVAGGMSSHGDMLAVMILSHHLGWPLVADPLSGVRLRASMNANSGHLVPFMVRVPCRGRLGVKPPPHPAPPHPTPRASGRANTPSWVYRRRLTSRPWTTTSCVSR